MKDWKAQFNTKQNTSLVQSLWISWHIFTSATVSSLLVLWLESRLEPYFEFLFQFLFFQKCIFVLLSFRTLTWVRYLSSIVFKKISYWGYRTSVECSHVGFIDPNILNYGVVPIPPTETEIRCAIIWMPLGKS